MPLNKQDRPRMRVKMRLTGPMQNQLLGLLHTHFGINESYPEDHVIYVDEKSFVKFLFAMTSDPDTKPYVALSRLRAEYVDMRKEPHITIVPNFGNYDPTNRSVENSED